mmetsp:Transcript_21332/g.25406  ORF Transcript_21332/g.25406 Transcript_21332/m.25406 type:complete len:115 (+) Transcript_21332:279-623(+)|eukprot:CAMPEP_0198248428 /NCGR_PEP_ID=MMETSP1447-20131203/189_1 /TAXON_ID=420782 /ORGANISM="Chaetoceros dichaeta, Strain CCMP1751" /LENGTH=114 /DNA_ID=CAMNT_0043932811 /DNA_START=204 /DNA_END=548 /DNA_ORIENTATION=-
MEQLPIIDMEEAMGQVDNDEEFLIELLTDFQEELDEKMRQIETVINNSGDPERQLVIKRAAHSIKGTASNLMCSQLAYVARSMEAANEQLNPETEYMALKTAYTNFKAWLDNQQ